MEKKAFDEGKKSSFTQAKVDALNAIGFAWAKRKGQAAWSEKFEQLVEYKYKYGDCECTAVARVKLHFSKDYLTRLLFSAGNVPTKYPKNPALGRWVSTQVCRLL